MSFQIHLPRRTIAPSGSQSIMPEVVLPDLSGAHGLTHISALPALERRQRLDSLDRPLLGEPQLVEALQVEPKFGTRAEEMAEAQGGIAGNGALPIEDPGDTVGWHLQLARELGGAHVERPQLLGELLAGMNCKACHGSLLGDSPQSQRWPAPPNLPATRNKSAIGR